MNILVVLSAKIISNELRYRFGDIPSVLIPFKEKVILDIIYEENKNTYDKIVVICGENKEQIYQYVNKNNYLEKIELVDVDLSDSLSRSTLSLKSHLNVSNITNLSILFGDTYVSSTEISSYLDQDAIFTAKVNDSSRWTIVTDEVLYDKEALSDDVELNAIIGFFNFTEPKIFLSLLETQSFYDALIIYKNKQSAEYVECTTWMDLGHEDMYIKSKKNKTRFFNTIDIDCSRGIIRKSSTDKQKLINEIKWFLKLPNKISYLTPRIFDYSLEYNDPFVEMEYYSYETLHEIYLYGNLNKKEWANIYVNLLEKLEVMKQYNFNLSKAQIDESLKEMYLKKTVSRLEKVKEDSRFKKFFEQNITINGTVYPNLLEVINTVSDLYKELKISEIESFSIIHGDYFFANILYDNTNNIVRLIDPRGDFGGYGIYGDSRYDLAKLMHSVDGKYDLIVEDSYYLDLQDTQITYNFITNKNHDNAEIVLLDTLKQRKYDINTIRFIQSILFLSMIPLHSDNFNRQILMMSRGIELVYKNEGVLTYA
jgi:hypothetical protein